ncbi:MAG: hypothetical protein F4012_02840, partial [Gemmatimonadales bacterium]|nr:hypothetical protein [Gemmatimonadales bacterium]
MRVRFSSLFSSVAAVAAFSVHSAVVPASLASQEGRPLELADYYRLKDAGSPALSPDGSRVAYVVTTVLEEENRRHSEIRLANADGSGEATRVTSPSFSASSPRWTPDGRHLVFTSNRPDPGGSGAGSTWFLR